MSENPPGFATRLLLAFAAFFRLLFDGAYASEVKKLGATASQPVEAPKPVPAPAAEVKPKRDLGPALQLLELLQREGRLIDFLKQDIVSFSDSDVGAAARIVHEGCKRAVERSIAIEAIRTEPEGGQLTLHAGFDAKSHRLVGNVSGPGPFTGSLKHRGWRATKVTLDEPLEGARLDILAPAEIEL